MSYCPLWKIMLFSDENTIIIASAKSFQINALVYSMVFRKDKGVVMLNLIIRTFVIRILWGRTVVLMVRIKGRQPSTRFPDLLLYGISVK